jgi:protein TonB
VGLHALALWLWVVGVQPLEIIKRPDISIEFFAPPAVQAVATQEEQPNASPSPSPSPPPAPPTPRQQPAAQPRAQSEPQPTAQIQQPASAQPAAAEAPPAQPTPSTAPAAQPATQAVMQTASTADADYKAAYLNNPKPPYPAAAVRRGAQGRVILLAEVLADGRAGRVQLERSSGHALLDASAMNTVRTWRFTPARKDGVIVTQTVRIPIEFNLREAR